MEQVIEVGEAGRRASPKGLSSTVQGGMQVALAMHQFDLYIRNKALQLDLNQFNFSPKVKKEFGRSDPGMLDLALVRHVTL